MSKFQIGDVVKDIKNPDQSFAYPLYSIKAAILVNNEDGSSKYMYEVASIYFPDESIICEEDSLEFQYHDTQWEEYFTESVGNGLPPWRGELYNYFMFFRDYSDVSLEEDAPYIPKEMETFKGDTIPPLRMQHILRNHSIFGRVINVVKSADNRRIIAEAININIEEVKLFASDFNEKIISRNATNTTYSKKIKDVTLPNFTKQERQFALQIDALDKSKGHMKDHYPYELTNLQIMDAIKEAYKNARKIGPKKVNKSNEPSNEDPDAPIIGKQYYEGYSKKYDLVIQFIYNFDYDFIETAYPIRMNNNSKKH